MCTVYDLANVISVVLFIHSSGRIVGLTKVTNKNDGENIEQPMQLKFESAFVNSAFMLRESFKTNVFSEMLLRA